MKKRVLYFDILNILAIIGVLFMHCNGIVHTFSRTRAWATALMVDCVFYFAVPVFIMLSGAKLLNYREKYDTKTFFKKRFMKVFFPSLFWMAFMLIWKHFKFGVEINGVLDFINGILTNRGEVRYYFIWIILGLYLTIPILSAIVKDEKNDKVLWYYVIAYCLFNSLLPYLFSLIGLQYNTSFSLSISNYVIFLVLGYLLSKKDIPKKYRIIIYIGAVIAIIYRYFMTYYPSINVGYVVKDSWGYTSFGSIVLACGVFLLIKNINFSKIENNQRISKIIMEISSCSFGIYLLHMFIKHYFDVFFNVDYLSWQYRLFGSIGLYLLCLLVVYILKKIPLVKKLVP